MSLKQNLNGTFTQETLENLRQQAIETHAEQRELAEKELEEFLDLIKAAIESVQEAHWYKERKHNGKFAAVIVNGLIDDNIEV